MPLGKEVAHLKTDTPSYFSIFHDGGLWKLAFPFPRPKVEVFPHAEVEEEVADGL